MSAQSPAMPEPAYFALEDHRRSSMSTQPEPEPGGDFAEFDEYCERHNIQPGETGAAFGAWLNRLSDGEWDGGIERVDPDGGG